MKKKNIVNLVLALLLVFALGTNVSAATATIDLPKNQTWKSISATRTGKKTSCTARCLSVYSTTSSDNFTRIQARIVSSSGEIMSTKQYYVLSETATKPTTINLIDGTYDNLKIKFQFRGNEPLYAARAKVSYDAR